MAGEGNGAAREAIDARRAKLRAEHPPESCDLTSTKFGKCTCLPELERGALACADLAWVETQGSAADRTKAAIHAYLWAVEVAKRDGLYPSLNQWRAAAGISISH